MWLPFACLAIGAIVSKWIKNLADSIMSYSLFFLLLGLGVRIGADRQLLASIPSLGLKSLVICFLSSLASILLVLIWEKCFLKNGLHNREDGEEAYRRAFSREYLFIGSVVLALVAGISLGHFLVIPGQWVEKGITIALIIIYISVGVGLKDGVAGLRSSSNKAAYLIIPVLILLASAGGGAAAAFLLKMDPLVGGGIGGGVSYYSLTAAMITQKAGIQLGFIAFLTNFLREVATFFLTPLLMRMSDLAPLALGGASTMDTTLAVMKRFLGEEYALLGFISGTLLTLLVPLLLLLLLSL